MAFAKSMAATGALVLGGAMFAPALAGAGQAREGTLVAVSADVKLRVIEAGPADAQTIVLIPGWCFTADIWSKQIAALSDRYRVVAFDPRSQGRSTILDRGNSPDARAEDIAGLIRALRLRKPVIVGWSQGVQDAAAYALAYGTGDIGGLVLVDAKVSAGGAGLDVKEAGETLGEMAIYTRSPRDYLEAMMSYLFRKPLSASERDAIVTAALRTPSSVGVANMTLSFYGKDYRPALKRIEVPTLLIAAGTAADRSEQLRQPIAKATGAVIEGAGHAVFHDEPMKFNELLAKFVEERVRGEAGR